MWEESGKMKSSIFSVSKNKKYRGYKMYVVQRNKLRILGVNMYIISIKKQDLNVYF